MKAFASWYWEDDKLTSGEQDDPVDLELKEIIAKGKGGDSGDGLPPAAITGWPPSELQEQFKRLVQNSRKYR